ncbi:hypothetical protein UFOVP826_2 [uncultured Caudovirales phage]|uniref:Uncharacterized protein n=1 Tax=uncultured Caudovirales phage TaxID=2100421 RepID=A0A6J5NXD0_9CAUD|nr:hypothetical protein UFOVP826_2 [uncultured Caudovirales phage]
MTERNDHELIQDLDTFWKKAGFSTHKFWIQKIQLTNGHIYHTIKSNLVNGMPPK